MKLELGRLRVSEGVARAMLRLIPRIKLEKTEREQRRKLDLDAILAR